MALLIMSMASVIMAVGIRTAVNTYQRMVEKANAQTLLSTTLTEMRTLLTNAHDVTVSSDGSSISFTDFNTKTFCTISSSEEDGIHYLNEISEDDASEESSEEASPGEEPAGGKAGSDSALVSDEAASRSLIVTCKFAVTGDTISIQDVQVKRSTGDGVILASVSKYLVKNW